MKKLLKLFIPPIIIKILKPNNNNKWTGNYKTWEEAKAQCSGYDTESILERVKTALLKVKAGKAAFERDSVLFQKPEFSWTILTILLKTAMEEGGKLHVLDFGGSLGSIYFQNRLFLAGLKDFSWNVIEQSHFVDCGQQYFQDDTLKFYSDIKTCMQEQCCNVLLLSSVLQYLEDPFYWIKKFSEYNFNYIFIDRTSFTSQAPNRLTIQKVPSIIYKASYPCWFFEKDAFISMFSDKYEIIAEIENDEHSNLTNTYFQGLILKRKTK